MPKRRVPDPDEKTFGDVVPPKVLEMLCSSGFPLKRGKTWVATSEVTSGSDMCRRALAQIDYLKGVSVSLALIPRSVPGDPVYVRPRKPDGSRGHNHWTELESLLRDLAPAGTFEYPYRYPDASTIIPKVLGLFAHPPMSCPGARAIPGGTYVCSLQIYFANLTMSIRIHRMRYL